MHLNDSLIQKNNLLQACAFIGTGFFYFDKTVDMQSLIAMYDNRATATVFETFTSNRAGAQTQRLRNFIQSAIIRIRIYQQPVR